MMATVAEGFTAPRDVAVVEGSRIELCTCYVCGAAIVLDWDDLHDPREDHLAWHAREEAKDG